MAGIDSRTAWAAVQSRDRRFDGRLVYAVKTTGIYCRASCPSRRPRRENVTFFPDPEAAERAGYRACFRCRPREATSPATELVRRACAYLDSEESISLADLARALGMSPFHLQRTFKRMMGLSPREYARARRVERLKALLAKSESVTAAIYDAGYGSASRVYEASNGELGMTPATYQKGGAGARIRFAIVPCPYGRLLVAATERGVCAVRFGEDARLKAELQREFPRATIERVRVGNDPVLQAVVTLAGEGYLAADLPLDTRATAFQRRVWKALQAIPAGQVFSYGEVAAALGRPTATRAVAQACARNPLAVVVPCHGVVRGDGGLGGYRWGIARKRALLKRERASRTKAEARAGS